MSRDSILIAAGCVSLLCGGLLSSAFWPRALLHPASPEAEARLSELSTRLAELEVAQREPAAQAVDVPVTQTRPVPSPSSELVELQARVRDLEAALASCQATDTVGAWLATLRPGERPSDGELKILAEWLEPYPVRLLPGEGLLLASWVKEPGAELWRDYGPTIDEALITFLGPARIAREVPAEKLAELREAWAEEIPQWR